MTASLSRYLKDFSAPKLDLAMVPPKYFPDLDDLAPQTGIVATALDGSDAGWRRLDSTLTYDDPARLATARLGDLISGGLSWTRPIRLGGIQLARNFGLRQDLVTLPLPAFSGTAAVPSTIAPPG